MSSSWSHTSYLGHGRHASNEHGFASSAVFSDEEKSPIAIAHGNVKGISPTVTFDGWIRDILNREQLARMQAVKDTVIKLAPNPAWINKRNCPTLQYNPTRWMAELSQKL